MCGEHLGDGGRGSSAVLDGAQGLEHTGAAEGTGLLLPSPALSGVWKRVKQSQGCRSEQSSFFTNFDLTRLRSVTGSIASVLSLTQEQQFTCAQLVQACPSCSATLPLALVFLQA